MAPVLAELAAAYEMAHPGVFMDLQEGDSNAGRQGLAAGEADLAAVSWQAPDSTNPEGLQYTAFGHDAIAIIVHPANPVPSLTHLQLRALYCGEIIDWEAIGGSGGEPLVISREEGSGTRQAFEALVMGSDRVTLNALVMPTSHAVIDYVATHRTSVGYLSAAWLDERVRVVGIEGGMPEPSDVRSGAYPLTRVLFLAAHPQPLLHVQSFLGFVLSSEGQAIVAKHHMPLNDMTGSAPISSESELAASRLLW